MVIEVDEVKEFAKLALCGRLWKITDDLNLLLQRSDALAVNLVSKEFQIINAEYALGWVDNDTMFIKAFQHQSLVVFVLFWARAGDEVVSACLTGVQSSQELVNEMLEGVGCIS